MKKISVLSFGMLLGILMSTFFGTISFAAEKVEDCPGYPGEGKMYSLWKRDPNEVGGKCILTDETARNVTFQQLYNSGLFEETSERFQSVYFNNGYYIRVEVIDEDGDWDEDLSLTDTYSHVSFLLYKPDGIDGGPYEGGYGRRYKFDKQIPGLSSHKFYVYLAGKMTAKEYCQRNSGSAACMKAESLTQTDCESLKNTYSFSACGSERNKIDVDLSNNPELMDSLIQGYTEGNVSVNREDLEALVQCTNIAYQECLRSSGSGLVGTSEDKKLLVPKVDDPSVFNKFKTNSLPVIIGNAIKGVLSVMGTIAFVMYMYGGILYMTAAGNSSKEEKAKKVLVWTTLGLVVILASYIIVNFVFEAFR